MEPTIEKRINDLEYREWLIGVERQILQMEPGAMIEIKISEEYKLSTLQQRIIKIRKEQGVDLITRTNNDSFIVIRIS